MLHYAPSERAPSWRLTPRIDGGFVNALEMARTIIRSSAHGPRAVLASGPPFNSFVAGLYVSRYFDVPLILDYRDEWCECPMGFVDVHPESRAWERRCLRAASRVIFTTESMREHALNRFPELARTHTAVVPNGWDAADFSGLNRDVPNSNERLQSGDEKLLISFVGSLVPHSDPTRFLECLRLAVALDPPLRERIRVQFVGYATREMKEVVSEFPDQELIEFHGPVSKRDALSAMRASDVLLLFNTPELARYVPGKLYEYVAMRRPILSFGKGGEVENIVRTLGVGMCIPSDAPAELAGGLEELRRLRIADRDGKIERWLAERTRERLSVRILNEVLAAMSARVEG